MSHLVDLGFQVGPALDADVTGRQPPLLARPPATQPLRHVIIPDIRQNTLPPSLIRQEPLLRQDVLHHKSSSFNKRALRASITQLL